MNDKIWEEDLLSVEDRVFSQLKSSISLSFLKWSGGEYSR